MFENVPISTLHLARTPGKLPGFLFTQNVVDKKKVYQGGHIPDTQWVVSKMQETREQLTTKYAL